VLRRRGPHRRVFRAGALIIREAGGRISDFHGGDGYLDSGNVVAGNPKTYAALSKLLAPFAAGVA
jgi:myo-inositol-1(or 4)-monophosphatase